MNTVAYIFILIAKFQVVKETIRKNTKLQVRKETLKIEIIQFLTQRKEYNHEMEKYYKIFIHVENAVKKLLRRER